MQFNFAQLLTLVMRALLLRLVNTARPASNYLFAQILPEIQRPDYQAKGGKMKVRTTMAGLASMDSPYPESGFVEVSTFSQGTAKIANQATLDEEMLRTLQSIGMMLMAQGRATNDWIQREMLNFYNKVIVQAHLDTMEYLRGQALFNHKIDWVFNGKPLKVDYGIKAKYRLATRTGANGYGGATSAFWSDIAALQKLLNYNVDYYILHPDTMNVIINNAENAVQVVSQANGRFVIRKMIEQNGTNTPSSDARDTITLITYGLEVEVLDPKNPNETIKLPVTPVGKILAVKKMTGDTYIVGQGSTPDLPTDLGFTHIAPTVENGGLMGRWGRLFTPESEPYKLRGQGVTNGLPILEAEDMLAVSTTEMPA